MEQENQSKFKKADFYVVTGDYQKATQYLNEILDADPENARAWYEKAKLPVLQEDIVIIQGCSISVSKYQSLDVTQKSAYLRQCGFTHVQALDVESLLGLNLLIEKEHIKYLENAVRFAKNEKPKYEKELTELKAKHNKRGEREKKIAITIGSIALPLVAIILGNLFYAFFQMGLPYLIFSTAICIVPYVLSVIGIAFYAKVKHEGNNTNTGLTLTFLSLIFSNITLISGIIFLIIK